MWRCICLHVYMYIYTLIYVHLCPWECLECTRLECTRPWVSRHTFTRSCFFLSLFVGKRITSRVPRANTSCFGIPCMTRATHRCMKVFQGTNVGQRSVTLGHTHVWDRRARVLEELKRGQLSGIARLQSCADGGQQQHNCVWKEEKENRGEKSGSAGIHWWKHKLVNPKPEFPKPNTSAQERWTWWSST